MYIKPEHLLLTALVNIIIDIQYRANFSDSSRLYMFMAKHPEFITQSDHGKVANYYAGLYPQNISSSSHHPHSSGGSAQSSALAETTPDPNQSAVNSEALARTPLLDAVQHHRFRSHICNKRICLRSKSALLVLLWNVLFAYGFQCVVDFTITMPNRTSLLVYASALSAAQIVYIGVGISSTVLLLFPLAIYLADVKFNRHKIILTSVCFAFASALIVYVGTVVFVFYFHWSPRSADSFIPVPDVDAPIIVLWVVMGFGGIVFLGSYIAFTANIVQFGVDALHVDVAHDDEAGSVIFIHWFVWTSNFGIFWWKIDWGTFLYDINFFLDYSKKQLYGIPVLSFLIALIIIGVSIFYVYRKHHLFQAQFIVTNLFKLVLQVIKYSVKQNRQCTERNGLMAKLDMAKQNYGGPFTAKQVEDVKVYAKLFCVLLILGPIFTVDIAVKLSSVPSIFATHMNGWGSIDMYPKWVFSYLDSFTALLVLLVIPLYVCLVGPSTYIPGIIKRIGIGIVLVIFSLISLLLIDTIGHKKHSYSTTCFLANDYLRHGYPDDDPNFINISSWFILFPHAFYAFAHIFLDIGIYEFICVTSPHGMKGLLLGTFYAIKGIFQLFSIVILLLFNSWSGDHSFPSCGFVYFLINIIIAFIGLMIYMCVVRKYRNLKPDDPEENQFVDPETIA